MLPITVQGTTVPVVEWNAARVVTLAMVDAVHRRPAGTAGRNFRENRERLEAGKHFHELTADEIRRQSLDHVFPPRTSKGIVLTERGYLMLVKSLTDDLAWQVQDELVEGYFRPSPEAPALPKTLPEALRLAADQAEAVERAKAVIAELQPRSDALALLVDANGSLNITEASKALQKYRVDLIEWLVREQWIYRKAGSWLGKYAKVEQGLIVHKIDTVERRDGSEKIVQQVRFTAKGMSKLAELFAR